MALKSDQGPKSKIGLRSALIFVVLERKNPSGTADRLRSSPKVVVHAHFSTFTILLYSRLVPCSPRDAGILGMASHSIAGISILSTTLLPECHRHFHGHFVQQAKYNKNHGHFVQQAKYYKDPLALEFVSQTAPLSPSGFTGSAERCHMLHY